MKLLMHTCCAPCSVYCIDTLRKEGIEPTLYWYNPNIHPYKEYELRKDCLIEYAKKININCIVEDEYGIEEFCKNTINNLSSRCVDYCYPKRLEQTFKYAKENGYDAVTTTLLYSIYQKHDFIKKICEDLSKKYEIEFLYRDFRYGFWEGHDKAKESGLYMQKYCGCVFSEKPNEGNKPQVPEGFVWPNKRNIEIKKIDENKEKYMKLLLEADPQEDIVRNYLKDGDMYVLLKDDEIICEAVITKVNEDIVELKNIATLERYRGKGYAKQLIKYLFGNYKQKYKKMIVGTTENNIPFYVKQGFDKYYKTVKNFFVDNYYEEIWDGDLHCIDMYYYAKDLKRE